MKSLLAFLFLAVVLTSCGHFHDAPTVSVWADGLWVTFWLPFLGSLPFFYQAYKGSKSSSLTRPDSQLAWQPSDKNVPIYKIWRFWFGVALQVIAWGIVIYVNSDYWK